MHRFISVGIVLLACAAVSSCGSKDCPQCQQSEFQSCLDIGPGDGTAGDVAVDAEVIDDVGDMGDGTLDVGPDVSETVGDVSKEVGEGEFGAPCLSNLDCQSGFCVEGPEGFVCSMPCLEDCPEGWVCRVLMVGVDGVSLCVPLGANLCKPCKIDPQCGDGLCLEIGDGHYCGRDCEESSCPEGYGCEDVVSQDGVPRRQCVPVTDACDCNVTSDGTEKPCVKENEIGVCLGFETCDQEKGWIGCTALEPAIESCDGIDNDCNGVADDNPVPPEEKCKNDVPGVGACPGQWTCKGENGWDCVGPEPKPEECNYIDDDCDGAIDEDFVSEVDGKYDTSANCGLCGNSCEGKIPFAADVECDTEPETPMCVVTDCVTGYYRASNILCLPQISNLCIPCVEDANCGATGDKCLDMVDGKYCGRNCAAGSVFGEACPDGYMCQDYGDGVKQCVPQSGSCDCTPANEGIHRVCAVENESGTCMGTETCDATLGWVNCTAKTPSHEFCDGLDNDCNGFVDDNLDPPTEPCANSWEDPASGTVYTCTADWVCTDGGEGTTWVCDAKQPKFETCNYLDDNCNGLIDEDYKVEGTNKYGAFDNCGACGVSCQDLVLNGTTKCDSSAPQPRCVVDECFEGYWKASDLSCMPFPESQCTACASDAACQVPGDLCLPADTSGKTYCLWDCSPDSLHDEVSPEQKTCPEGYYCKETDSQGQPFYLSGTCDCLADNDGESRICEVSNDFGTCLGQETCDPDQGWVGCTAKTPAFEVCNDIDDDCNGITDELYPQLNAPCFVGIGTCRAVGVMVCNTGGDDVECSAVPLDPVSEVCDGQDNDCDDAVDEDWPDKGKVCTEGVGECHATGTWVCTVDGAGVECNAEPGVPAAEECDGLDNDCDGSADEDWADLGKACTVGQGECFATGTWVCNGDASGIECSAVEGTPGTETCDGLDNDCDGEVDEDWSEKGRPCFVGVGECLTAGTLICAADGAGIECDAEPGVGVPEICDGLDNDCDGAVDEDWADLGKVCTTGQGECLASGVNVCKVDGTGMECNAVEGAPVAEVCDGLDNDCDGEADEDWSEKGKPCSEGQGECLTNGVNVCKEDGSGIECDAVAGTPAAETCDGLDNDCDGDVDEDWADLGKACTAGVGECFSTGTFVCLADGSGIECDAVAETPSLERCDGLDNDCDGSVDEDWADLGKVCSAGVGECRVNGVQVCNAAGTGLECNAVAGTPSAETCDDLDNDCDGSVDEDWADLGKVCTAGQGECLASGTYECRSDGTGIECNAVEGTPDAETCDGLDNDCDGSVDEDWEDKGKPCSAGQGECLANGVYVCLLDGSGVECDAKSGSPAVEECDGLDNDCDGAVDEDWEDKGKPCSAGQGECLTNGVNVCKADGTDIECDAVAGSPSTERCDNLDNDCDGAVDEDWADLGKVCSVGVGECRVNGVQICNAAGTGLECNAVAGAPSAETCDGLDNDCDGVVDEDWADLGKVCTAGQGECLASGTYECRANGTGIECNAVEGTPVAETCDGLDNDCDGDVDDYWPSKGKPCTSGLGECQASGVNVCTADGTGLECNAVAGTPSTETCDGLDNDCDGSIDEDWADKGKACSVGQGECLANGVNVCNAGGTDIECDAVAGTPVAETCDGLDNDCDGSIDENWSDKGKPCSAGVGECLDNGVQVCKGDGSGLECNAVAGKRCDGLDNDCDGSVDEDWSDKGKACTAGQGECLANGVNVCNAGGTGIECDAVPGTPVSETCDGLDNDCDGDIDEDWPTKGTVCSTGQGECVASGVYECLLDGSDVECSAVAGTPASETCDGLDNDCDGSIDENWADKGKACSVGQGECLANGVNVCNADGTDIECDAVAGTPVAETCDGLDNDCDGSIDENWSDKGKPCSAGQGECLANGVNVCKADGTDIECNAVAGTPASETCDGLDNDCDGSVDEDWPTKGQACSAGQGECLASGVNVCKGDGSGVECDAIAGTPGSETCDYLDNDCDGSTDEDYISGGKYYLDTACGNCFTDCTAIYALSNAYGTCDYSGTPTCVMNCNGGYFDLNSVPDDGCEFNLDGDAIYVSGNDSAAADDGTCGLGPVGTGSGNHPCLTISQGLVRAASASRGKVLVADGLYEETVVMVNGVSLLGGYRADTWERNVSGTNTTLRGNSTTGNNTMTVRAENITEPTTLQGFVIYGESNFNPGGNSYAVYVRDSTSALTISDNVIFGGYGGAGDNGSAGGDAADGTDGAEGEGTINPNTSNLSTCQNRPYTPGNQGTPGDAGSNYCGGTDVSGGDGAAAQCPNNNDQEPTGDSGHAASGGGAAGVGGVGGHDRQSNSFCSAFNTAGYSATGLPGTDGGRGSDGGAGSGCANSGGNVLAGHWVG
ncbi:MAG: hypothetical protein GXP54_04280, partial [Deltaproteobacteria bacterium]|nr:hypothetical protein [Deltaproteobacteria bacterium]